jgi:hypothetical protein
MKRIFRAHCVLGFLFFLGASLQMFGIEAGSFQGILQSDSNNDESFGFITLKLNSSGSFSMKFNLGVNKIGHHSYSRSGQFDSSGHYHYEGPEPTGADATRYAIARIIDLQLDNTDSPQTITGEVTDLTHSSTVEIERVGVFNSANPAPQSGNYTFLIFNNGDAGLPRGTGFGTAKISSAGKIKASGRSADGRTFHQSAAVTVSGRWPVFAKLGGNTGGILSGWLIFQETAQDDFSGNLVWLGPEEPGPNHAFVPEFSGTVFADGSRYNLQKGAMVLQTSSSENNVHLNLSDGGIETPIDRDLTLTSKNKFIFPDKMAGDALSVKSKSGLFTGKFMHPDGKVVTFRGAILQKQNAGAGQFVDPNGEIGNAQLTPQ